MTETVSDILALRAQPAAGLNGAISASVAAHVLGAVVLIVAQGYWIAHQPPPQKFMQISLSGSEGPRSTGLNAAGGRPIEEVAPEPKRPEPIKTAAARPDVMTLPVKSEPHEPERVDRSLPIAPMPKPPTTGRQITPGTALAETGARGLGTGLTVGGAAGAGASLEINDFCCMDYLRDVVSRIEAKWRKDAPERGVTVLRFVIQRNGQITDITTDSTTDSLLELQSRAALDQVHLPPLPDAFKEDKLVIHLKFPYGIQ